MVVMSSAGDLKADGEEYALKGGYVFFTGYNTEPELAAMDNLETHIAHCEV